MNNLFDLVIVGAGITGTFAAYLAAEKQKGLRILLIDRGLLGGGTTHYSLGLDYPYGHTELKQTMTKESITLWNDLLPLLSDLQREVPLYGLVSREKWPKVKNGLLNKNAVQTDSQFDTRIKPRFSKDQILLTGLSCKYNQTREITQRLARRFASMSENNKLWECIEVKGIEPGPTSFSLDLVGHPAIITEKLLLCMGPWIVQSPFMDFFKDTQVRTKKIVSLFIDKPPQLTDPAFFFFDEDAFLLPMTESSRWMFSFTIYTWDCHPNAPLWEITAEDRQVGISLLEKYLPEFVPYCHGGRAFCDAYHHDWTPLITASKAYKNLVVATGGSGSGFRLAPSMASRALHSLGL